MHVYLNYTKSQKVFTKYLYNLTPSRYFEILELHSELASNNNYNIKFHISLFLVFLSTLEKNVTLFIALPVTTNILYVFHILEGEAILLRLIKYFLYSSLLLLFTFIFNNLYFNNKVHYI